MPQVSLGEAARLTGHGKSTIARSIKSGRLSATRTAFGSYEIDTSELLRVYPFKAPQEPGAETAGTGADTAPLARHATASDTDAQIAALQEVSALLRSQLEDVREDRDRWRSAHERASATLANLAQLALPPPPAPSIEQDATPVEPPVEAVEAPVAPPKRRRWWQRA